MNVGLQARLAYIKDGEFYNLYLTKLEFSKEGKSKDLWLEFSKRVKGRDKKGREWNERMMEMLKEKRENKKGRTNCLPFLKKLREYT